MSENIKEVNESNTTAYADPFSLDALLAPQISRVSKSLMGLSIVLYGDNGTGKTPVACQFPKPYYLAFGKNGLTGLNNVPFRSFHNWGEYKTFANVMFEPTNFERISQQFNTFIFDETEMAFRYCEKYTANTEGVNKIKEGNGGYGLWKDWETEWKDEIVRILGSGFTVIFIFKQVSLDGYNGVPYANGFCYPRGDKRMLPVILDNCDIIGCVAENGHTGKIHSSLVLRNTEAYPCFARTRNEYFDPFIDDVTADKITEAYYAAIDRQAEAENVAPVTKAEQDQMYAKPKERNVKDALEEANALVVELVKKEGQDSALGFAQEIIKKHLGEGKKLGEASQKQIQNVEVIIGEFKKRLAE